jgi:very-long-chain (3R)-3-hydroxyacyl-CoA dehydratase
MSNAVKYYLGAFNAAAFIFWAAYIICFIATGFYLNPQTMLLLNIAQGLAVLEIVHALLKWVKSPVGSTIVQVSSRLLVLVLINMFNTGSMTDTIVAVGIVVVSFAWSITELVRYSLYFLSLFNKQPGWLLWMRYSFFIVLYPTGVVGEWLIILAPVIIGGVLAHGREVPLSFYGYRAFAVVLFISYAYYFPVLYGYMWKQRKAKIG